MIRLHWAINMRVRLVTRAGTDHMMDGRLKENFDRHDLSIIGVCPRLRQPFVLN